MAQTGGEVPEMQEKRRDDELNSKFSTEQLICKTPQESPNASVKSANSDKIPKGHQDEDTFGYLLHLGSAQILLGAIMMGLGVLVILNEARMALLGAGVWGGSFGVVSGVSGVMAAAKSWCPLKGSAQRVAHTVFLALSLIGIAISQLVLVLAATGLARDINRTDIKEKIMYKISPTPATNDHDASSTLNYEALLCNSCLIIASALQCLCAAVASYKSARALCPCFRNANETNGKLSQNSKDAFVSSWLGKHTMPPSLYVVSAPNNKNKNGQKWNSDSLALAPVVHSMLPPPPVMGFPLIPAPLGPVPSPIIPFHPSNMIRYKHKVCYSGKRRVSKEHQKKPYSKPKRKLQEIDVTQTYTGLDRVIAEEFIDICDSRNNSLCTSCSFEGGVWNGCSCTNEGCAACTTVCNNVNCNLNVNEG